MTRTARRSALRSALRNAIDFAGLTPSEVATLKTEIDRTLSPGSKITPQFNVTMDNLRARISNIHENRMAIYAIAYIEAHPFYAGKTIAAI